MNPAVKVAFASCKPDLLPAFVERFAAIAPESELFIVSEFPPPMGRWIPYRVDRSFRENSERLRAALRGRRLQYAAIILQPATPHRALQLMALRAAPFRTLVYNTNLDHFMLRPSGLRALVRHAAWRLRERVRFQLRPGGDLYTWLWRITHPAELRRPAAYAAALAAGGLRRPRGPAAAVPKFEAFAAGISVVIPTRNGRLLLQRLLPLILTDADEIIVVDNGSDDGTAEWLAREYPGVRVEVNARPLSFARAVNRGIFAAQYSHVCLLNNDMAPEPGFLPNLRQAFDRVPELFCATAQIFFPAGKRREETGKAVMRPPAAQRTTTEFPVHCAEPIPGEDLTYVLYGSGGCSLYDASRLRTLGGIDEVYEPAYVEDLDIGVRAWQRGWPTVFVASARTLHDHRATTSRYYTEAELNRVLERNYLLFLTRTVASAEVFRRLWHDAIVRLNRKAALEHDAASADVLATAWRLPRTAVPGTMAEDLVFALGSGDVAVFPGRAPRREHTVLIASCYPPFPLSHGGAVRMYNLMSRAAADFTQVLITFVDDLHTPPPELTAICAEVVQVRREGSHVQADTGRPDVVGEFDSPAFRGALLQTLHKWQPAIAQLEFTQMAQYAADCAPARTILVEHDVTIDLYRQLLALGDDWEIRRQLERWVRFETAAWSEVDRVVTMSERDRAAIKGAVTIPNGVDLQRFRPTGMPPEPARLLFIGSFAHLPNLLALDFFLREVWPGLSLYQPVLHVIAGAKHRCHFERWRDRLSFSPEDPRLQLEDFVADVRPAYARATVVIAPLLASAGTNIKIMEAMAMGKAIVSTTAGINGLDELRPGHDLIVEDDPKNIGAEIGRLFRDPAARQRLEENTRAAAERAYDWDSIAQKQRELYRELISAGAVTGGNSRDR